MDKLEKKVLCTIDKLHLIAPGQTVIAAVSGGYDSVCMLHILKALMRLRKFDLCAAHVNHSLRPEADRDAEFVTKISQTLGIMCYTEKADVSGYAKDHKMSFETAGREIRYSFFEKVARQVKHPVIATAHTANDSAESFFMHLLRGSGLTGLTGIQPVRGNIIRPMIEISRQEIETYCTAHTIEIAHDSTNDCDDYTRNDIRHNVLPAILQRCNIQSLTRTMQVLSEEEAFLEEYTTQLLDKYIVCCKNGYTIKTAEFNPLPLAVKRRLLRRILPKQNMGLLHIDECITMANNNRGGKKTILPGGVQIEMNQGILKIKEVQTNDKGH